MNTKATDLDLAEVPLNYARMNVRDLVQQAYEAGKSTRNDDPAKPSADEVNRAIQSVERGAVVLAHARMEHVAKACGFEGLTEALGYLQTLRANPLADLLREAVNLCAIGDVTPSEDVAAEGGWSNWMYRARGVVGDKPPPELETLGDGPLPAYDPPRQILSGCAVRATIQREADSEEPPNDEALADLEHARDEAMKPAAPTNRHGQTCAQTCGEMAAGGFHSALCHTVEAMMGGTPTSKH